MLNTGLDPQKEMGAPPFSLSFSHTPPLPLNFFFLKYPQVQLFCLVFWLFETGFHCSPGWPGLEFTL